MWEKKIVEADRQPMIVWRTYIACCIPKAADTHLEYIIFVFPLQKMAPRKRLHDTLYVHCLSCTFCLQYDWFDKS